MQIANDAGRLSVSAQCVMEAFSLMREITLVKRLFKAKETMETDISDPAQSAIVWFVLQTGLNVKFAAPDSFMMVQHAYQV